MVGWRLERCLTSPDLIGLKKFIKKSFPAWFPVSNLTLLIRITKINDANNCDEF